MSKAVFPGTFDPFTTGHASVVRRALGFIDEIVIGIGINEEKSPSFPLEKREQLIKEYYKAEPRVAVQSYEGLTVDFCKQVGATLIIRGVRSIHDFEYEAGIADINRQLAGIETLLLLTEPELSSVSSSVVRELLKHGKDISRFVPQL